MLKKYLLYLARWQLSTPILAGVLILFSFFNPVIATIIANVIGGLIFFWVDRFIFKQLSSEPLWEIKEDIVCHDCHRKVDRGYRIVQWLMYDRLHDKNPQYRCSDCALKKAQIVKDSIKYKNWLRHIPHNIPKI